MWDGPQIEEAWAAAEKYNAYPPVVEQPYYNMMDRQQLESEQEETLSNRGMGTVVFSPLAGGLLTGKYNNGMPPDSRGATATEDWMIEQFSEHRIEKARELTVIAEELGVTLSALALAWVLKHPNVDSAIIGASKPKQVTRESQGVSMLYSHPTLKNALRPFCRTSLITALATSSIRTSCVLGKHVSKGDPMDRLFDMPHLYIERCYL